MNELLVKAAKIRDAEIASHMEMTDKHVAKIKETMEKFPRLHEKLQAQIDDALKLRDDLISQAEQSYRDYEKFLENLNNSAKENVQKTTERLF